MPDLKSMLRKLKTEKASSSTFPTAPVKHDAKPSDSAGSARINKAGTGNTNVTNPNIPTTTCPEPCNQNYRNGDLLAVPTPSRSFECSSGLLPPAEWKRHGIVPRRKAGAEGDDSEVKTEVKPNVKPNFSAHEKLEVDLQRDIFLFPGVISGGESSTLASGESSTLASSSIESEPSPTEPPLSESQLVGFLESFRGLKAEVIAPTFDKSCWENGPGSWGKGNVKDAQPGTPKLGEASGTWQSETWVTVRGRKVIRFGGEVLPSGKLKQESLPPILEKLCHQIGARLFPQEKIPNHVLVNRYAPGDGIFPHTDGPAYHPLVAILSLNSDCAFDFRGSSSAGRGGGDGTNGGGDGGDRDRCESSSVSGNDGTADDKNASLASTAEPAATEPTKSDATKSDLSISLSSTHVRVVLPSRSLLWFGGRAYHDCLHGIEWVRYDTGFTHDWCSNSGPKEGTASANANRDDNDGVEEPQSQRMEFEGRNSDSRIQAPDFLRRGVRYSLTVRYVEPL